MPAVKCNYHENIKTADKLYLNDERNATSNAVELRNKYREECAGETAQCRDGKDGLQQIVRGILPPGENRVLAEDSYENHGVRLHAQADIQPCAGSVLP